MTLRFGLQRRKVSRRNGRWLRSGAVATLFSLSACAANPTAAKPYVDTTSELPENASSVQIRFRASDFFSLTNPYHGSGCAGDAKTYYPGFANASSIDDAFTLDANAEMSQKPDFVRNIAVDLTDTNAPMDLNEAYSCSMGQLSTLGPTNCAAFDYGAVAGIPTTLGGTLLLMGGTQGNSDASGATATCAQLATDAACSTSMFAVAIDSQPKTTETTDAVSSWSNLASGSGYAGPAGLTGATVALNADLQRALLLGGSTYYSTEAVSGSSAAMDTADSWILDLKTQSWNKVNAPYSMTSSISVQSDVNGTVTRSFNKNVGSRAAFGYAAVPFASNTIPRDAVNFSASVTGKSDADITDRIFVVGGYSSSNEEATMTRKFNPTFGPEWMNLIGRSTGSLAATDPYVWIDSSPFQLLSNDVSTSRLNSVNNGAAPTSPKPTGISLAPVRESSGGFKAGSAVVAGGFDEENNAANPDGNTDGAVTGGAFYYTERAGSYSNSADLAGITNTLSGNRITPIDYNDGIITGGNIPKFGGGALVPGFHLGENDLVFFGGTKCQDYLTNFFPHTTWTAPVNCDTGNPGGYFRLGGTIGGAIASNPGFAGDTPPNLAGLSASRGQSVNSSGVPTGNTVIVGWGGLVWDNGVAKAPVVNNHRIWVLYNAGTTAAPTPTWVEIPTTSISATRPVPRTAAAMVYSHVTGKFYMFGGYQIQGAGAGQYSTTALGDTWELQVIEAAGPAFTATWRQLNTPGGLTCYPSSCPTARHSHQIVEANYNNNAAVTGSATVSPEPLCTDADNPCSFGIFMEGGKSSDGSTIFSDRWMFDPTANGGRGHWQKVDNFPPRRLAVSAALSYTAVNQPLPSHRAVLFGGETSHQSPAAARASNYFVAPTLGDTQMYDFTTGSWNRVQLLGKGYSADTIPDGLSEFERRQAFSFSATKFRRPFFMDLSGAVTFTDEDSIAELSPPPLAGATVVVRTYPRPLHGSPTSVTPLIIPEVFVFGGRMKDGKLNPLDHVYKFCAGSTGERTPIVDGTLTAGDPMLTDDASCDAYDPATNPNSPSPSADFVGRWIRKTPDNNPATTLNGAGTTAFMGAGVYDSNNDRIVLFGGRNVPVGSVTTTAITKTASISVNGNQGEIFEYTPPSKINTPHAHEYNGRWTNIPACLTKDPIKNENLPLTAPEGRYGHSMAYDDRNQQVIVVGGFRANGTALAQDVSDGSTSSKMPEVWIGKRMTSEGRISAADPTIVTLRNDTITDVTAETPCYYWRKKTTFSNTLSSGLFAPKGIGSAASLFVPSAGYNTTYYTMFDNACVGQGPYASSDPETSKKLAGGVYIDLNRSGLASDENLLLNITYLPLGPGNNSPRGSKFTMEESAVLKVHLIKNGQSEDLLRSIIQPRYLSYITEGATGTPYTVETLAVLAPPTGEIRQDQLVIPLSIDPYIDRIRIERVSGSAILIDASLYRLGPQ